MLARRMQNVARALLLMLYRDRKQLHERHAVETEHLNTAWQSLQHASAFQIAECSSIAAPGGFRLSE